MDPDGVRARRAWSGAVPPPAWTATKRARAALLALALLVAGPAGAQTPPDRAPLVFGIYPFFAANRMEDIYGPFTSHLERALRRPVRFTTTSTFERYTANLAGRVYDLAFVNPFEYLSALDEYGYVPLARPRDPIATWFLARPDSTLAAIGDLKGQTVAMAPASAANSLIGLYALRQAGLVPGRDVTVRHYESHQTCIHHMMIGTAAVCVTGRTPRRLAERDYGMTLRLVHEAPSLPPPLFVAHVRLPEAERAAITRAITGLADTAEGREVVDRTGFSGFIPTDGKEYDAVRAYRRLIEGR